MSFRLISFWSACAAFLWAVTARAEPLTVNLILSDGSPPYRQFADTFNRRLAASQSGIHVIETPDTGSDLTVAVGMKAANQAVTQTTGRAAAPILAVMVPEAGYRELLMQAPSRKMSATISAIYLDQPWGRQLDFIQAALPGRRRIGLLYSPDARLDLGALRRHVAARGNVLAAQPVRDADNLFAALESVLNDSDILLAIPDSAIYSGSTIRNILLTSYRRNIPLVGLSAAYVKAGALCAVFSTPEQLAEQTADAVIAFARNGQLPAPRYPDSFTIDINRQVARSLGIDLPPEETVRGRMSRMPAQ